MTKQNERNSGAVITMADNVIHGGDDTYNCFLCRGPIVDGERVYLDVNSAGLNGSGVFAIHYRHVGERVLYSVYDSSGPDPTIPATIVDDVENGLFGYLVADADMTGPTWDLDGASPLCEPEMAYDARIVTEDEFTTARNQEAN